MLEEARRLQEEADKPPHEHNWSDWQMHPTENVQERVCRRWAGREGCGARESREPRF
jgi:hypothetical protein